MTRIGRSQLRKIRIGFLVMLVLCSIPVAAAVNFHRLEQFASLSEAVYLNAPESAMSTALPDFQITRQATIRGIEISYLLARDVTTDEQYIAVRGTSNIENALVDIALKLRHDSRAGIKLHEGFALAAQQIYRDVLPFLEREKNVHTTGHSLGGAVSVILAMYLDQDGFKVGDIATFGQPKLTNIAGSRKFAHLDLLRVVTPLDVVPLVPPLDPLDIQNLDIYWHLGTEVVLERGRSYSLLSGVDAMLRATKFTQQMMTEQNLANHQIDEYLTLIRANKTGAREVPFQNNFNLFNLFEVR